MAESFSRQKSRHALQKEGGLKILCDLPPVQPRLVRLTNLMSRMDGKKTHTHYCERSELLCERSELLIRQVYQFELGCIKKIAH